MALQLELLLVEAVSLISSIEFGDLLEARFRARRIGDLAWSDNNSAIGNAAMNLEVALRDVASPEGVHEDLLTYLLSELDIALKPLRRP